MNEEINNQLNNALSKILNKTVDGIDAATGFLADEIPDVIQQIIMWHGVYYGILFLLGIGVIVGAILAATKLGVGVGDVCGKDKWGGEKRKLTLTHDSDGDMFPLGAGFIAMSLMIAFIPLNLQWLKIIIAPKLWLIEYAARLAS